MHYKDFDLIDSLLVNGVTFNSVLRQPWCAFGKIILLFLQVLSPDVSLATVRAYIWKKSEDLVLNYRLVQGG